MKNLRIGVKLLVTFMIIIVLFCATVASAIYGLKENEAKYSEFYNVGYQITNKVMSMRRGLQIIVKDIAYITIEDDSAKSKEHEADMEKELTLLEENATWLFENFEGEQELLDSFAEDITQAVELQKEVIHLADTDMDAARTKLLEEYQPLVSEAVNTLIQISAFAEEDAEQNYQSTTEMQRMLVMAQLAMAGGALVITLLLSTYLTGAIRKPLHELEVSAGKIVSGDLDIDIKYESKDELGGLAKAFKNMTSILSDVISDASRLLQEMADGNFDVRTRAEDRYVGDFQGLLLSIRKLNKGLSSTLGQINLSADQVASGASQVSNGSQALSQGATEQASAVEELAATISNISQQIKETAQNALDARKRSGIAGDEMRSEERRVGKECL